MGSSNDLGGGRGLYDRFDYGGRGDPNKVDNARPPRIVQGADAIQDSVGPFTLSANQNDLEVTGGQAATIVLLSASTTLNITGFVPTVPGELKTYFLSTQSATITLVNASALSSTANQLNLGSNVTVPAGGGFTVWYDPNGSRWRLAALFVGTAGTGDVVGPASATDNALARFDGTTGKLIQNSSVVVDDSGNVSAGAISASQVLVSGTLTASEAQFTTPLAMAFGGLAAATSAAARTNLGLVIGGDIQSFSTSLQALSTANVQPAGINVLTASSTASIGTYLGLVVGTTVQSYSSKLQTIATAPASTIPFNDSSGTERNVALGSVNTVLSVNSSGGLYFTSLLGTGDVVGPASASDSAIVLFDTTTGKLVKNSPVTIDSSGNVSAAQTLQRAAGVWIQGRSSSDSVTVNYVGYYTAAHTVSSGVNILTGSPANALSITLPPGDWSVTANGVVVYGSSGTVFACGLNTASATLPSFDSGNLVQYPSSGVATAAGAVPMTRFALGVQTTVYLVVQSTFSGSATAGGKIEARRT